MIISFIAKIFCIVYQKQYNNNMDLVCDSKFELHCEDSDIVVSSIFLIASLDFVPLYAIAFFQWIFDTVFCKEQWECINCRKDAVHCILAWYNHWTENRKLKQESNDDVEDGGDVQMHNSFESFEA